MAAIPGAAGPGAPFPQWTVNTTGWVVAEVINAEEKALAIAATWPNKLIFFTSKAAADAYVQSQGQTPITTPAASLGGQAALNAGSQAAAAAVGGLKWTAGLSGISGHNLLVRTLKIIIGGLLLIEGIMKMTGTDKTLPSAALKGALLA